MQVALTQGTVTRVATHVPAKYKKLAASRAQVAQVAATFGRHESLPGFAFPVGTKVRTTNGTTEWTIVAQAETPAGTSPRSYKAVAGKMERVFGENALRSAETPKFKIVDVALNSDTGEIEPVGCNGLDRFDREDRIHAALVAEYGPERLPGTFAAKPVRPSKAPKPATEPKARVNAPFKVDGTLTLVKARTTKPTAKNHAWNTLVMDALAAGNGSAKVSDVLAAGKAAGYPIVAEIKHDLDHGYVTIA